MAGSKLFLEGEKNHYSQLNRLLTDVSRNNVKDSSNLDYWFKCKIPVLCLISVLATLTTIDLGMAM